MLDIPYLLTMHEPIWKSAAWFFELSVKSGCKERYYTECFLNRDKTSNIDFDIKYCNGFEYAAPEKKAQYLAKQ